MILRLTLAIALGIAPAAAQTPAPTPYARAVAAGYKALTLCSAMWNAGRTREQAEKLELTGIYPEYDRLVPTLPAAVDRATAMVSVHFDPKQEPRRAQWHRGRGCTILPIGSREPPSPAYDQTPSAVAGADPRPWPMGDADIAPAPAGPVADVVQGSFQGRFGRGARTVGALVVRDGAIVAERYADGFGPFTANRTWSVAKSLAGTLVGRWQHLGKFDVKKRANIPEWGGNSIYDPREDITNDQLLRMSSGLHSDAAGNRTDAVYFGGSAVGDMVTGWPLIARPGTQFRYANNDILLAIRSLRATIGDAAYDDAAESLFRPIGMTHTVAETDWRGNYILSSQVWTTARDLARFGLLYLNNGMWQGRRILPADWVKYVTTPSGPQPYDREFGYGATFWLMNNSPGVPADTYAAFGNRGQYVVIVPSRRVVIVRRGEDGTGIRFDIAKFTADVLAALK